MIEAEVLYAAVRVINVWRTHPTGPISMNDPRWEFIGAMEGLEEAISRAVLTEEELALLHTASSPEAIERAIEKVMLG